MATKITLDTSCYARIEEAARPDLAHPIVRSMGSLDLYLNKEALQESLGLMNDRDPERMKVRARVILEYWSDRVLRSPGEIMRAELEHTDVFLETTAEARRFREIFRMVEAGARPAELVAFAQQAARRKQMHVEWWGPIKKDFFEHAKRMNKNLRLESWVAFRESMWTEEDLIAGSRVPPNGEVEFGEAVDAVLASPGEYPITEGYLTTCLNFIHRILRDPRSVPREPGVYDMGIVMYMAKLDVLVTSESALSEMTAEVFGPVKETWQPLRFVSQMQDLSA